MDEGHGGPGTEDIWMPGKIFFHCTDEIAGSGIEDDPDVEEFEGGERHV